MKRLNFLFSIFALAICSCNQSIETFETWQNGIAKEKRVFTRSPRQLIKTIQYDSMGRINSEDYFDDLGVNYASSKYDEFGIKKEQVYFRKPKLDTVHVTSGIDSGVIKVIAYYDYYTEEYYPNGKFKQTGFMIDGKKDSIFKYYDYNGILLHTEFYKADSLIYRK